MRLLQTKPPKSLDYYNAMYVRKGRAIQMLGRDTLSDQKELARQLSNATIVNTPADDSTPSPPE